MAAQNQKETIMMLKVDLDCPCCYKKVKKLLCSIPQIRDQTYNEQQNIVMIKVVCCNPQKIREKLRCKGGKSIKDIQIYSKPREPPIQQNQPVQGNQQPKQPVQPNLPRKQQVQETPNPGPAVPKPGPQNPVHPTTSCCSDCYEGRRTGPCYNGYGYGYGYGYGVPPPPPPPAGGWGYYYYGGCPSGGYRPGYCISPCVDYVSNDNPTLCVTM